MFLGSLVLLWAIDSAHQAASWCFFPLPDLYSRGSRYLRVRALASELRELWFNARLEQQTPPNPQLT